MNKNEEKLQKGYHQLVENIENLIEEKGESLTNALEHAEERFEETEDYTKSEAQQIIGELRHDLYNLAEKLDDAKESFKQQMQMNRQFMKSNAIQSLSNITEKALTELKEIKESMLQKELDFVDDINLQAHQDHSEWQNDLSFWLKEIEMWRKENHEAGGKLLEIHDAIRLTGHEMQEQAKTLHAHQQAIDEHETLLAKVEQYKKNGEGTLVISEEDQKAHEAMRKEHKIMAKLHQQFKNKHREMVSLIGRLYQLNDL